MITKLKRIVEMEDVTEDDLEEVGLQPEVPNSEDIDQELPAEGETSADQYDVMTLTLADFCDKVKEIDPLVHMGLMSFIEKNAEAFGGSSQEGPGEEGQEGPVEVPDGDDFQFTKTIKLDKLNDEGQDEFKFSK